MKIVECQFSLSRHIDQITDVLKANSEIRLIILDPLSAFLGVKDSHRDSDVREVLRPLFQMAADYGVTVIGIVHLNKTQSSDPIARFIGSTGISTPCIEWLGETDKDAFEVLAPRLAAQKDRPAIDGAKDWLNKLLEEGPVKSVKVKEASKESPHAWMTIRRAAAELKIQSIKRGPFHGSTWWWMTKEQTEIAENPDEQVQAEGDHEDAQTGKPLK